MTKALVPTMGALHDGHLALVNRARELADTVVVSIFVNPTQFGAGEDFDRYPRTLDADRALVAGLADVFAPTADEVYPADAPPVVLHAGARGDLWEGAARPGYFDGVLTVVNRLFEMVRPDVAIFGEKDWQQLALIRTMAAERHPSIRIEAVPTVREPDGLALSSRNRYLSEDERRSAAAIPTAFKAVARRGATPEVLAAARVHLRNAGVNLDYLNTVDPVTLEVTEAPGPARLIFAGIVGTTRLIDNQAVEIVVER